MAFNDEDVANARPPKPIPTFFEKDRRDIFFIATPGVWYIYIKPSYHLDNREVSKPVYVFPHISLVSFPMLPSLLEQVLRLKQQEQALV